MKLSFKTILPIILISALLILLTGCFPIDESPGATPDEGEEECEDLIANAGGCYCATVCPDTDALINLSGSASGTGPFSYAWDLDDDDSFDDSTQQNPQGVPFGVGNHTVTLRVTDDCGNKATATTSVEVSITACINHAPVIDNLPPAIVQWVDIPQTYTYDVDATDIDGDTLTYSLTTKPNGMTIDSLNGEITWTNAQCPVASEVGLTKGDRCYKLCEIPVTVRVTDDGCCGPLFDEESFIVEVWQP